MNYRWSKSTRWHYDLLRNNETARLVVAIDYYPNKPVVERSQTLRKWYANVFTHERRNIMATRFGHFFEKENNFSSCPWDVINVWSRIGLRWRMEYHYMKRSDCIKYVEFNIYCYRWVKHIYLLSAIGVTHWKSYWLWYNVFSRFPFTSFSNLLLFQLLRTDANCYSRRITFCRLLWCDFNIYGSW